MQEKETKKPEVKEEKISEETLVVEELPQQPVRVGMSEDGKTKITFVTKDEALTEILKIVKELKKGIVG